MIPKLSESSSSGPTHIKDLIPDPANRREHNPRNIGMVSDALREVGAARSIVIDEDNVILAGNGVTEAAAEAGITRLRVVEADGNELIAVRRSGLSAEQKRALAIYDNRTAELAEWNYKQLGEDKATWGNLQPFWTPEEEKILLAKHLETKGGLTDPDDVPQERPTSIVAGDIFELGRHRLLCGDSTSGADIARLIGSVRASLVLTDPPYGIDIVNVGSFKLGKIGGDKRYGPARDQVGPVVVAKRYRPIVGDDLPFDPRYLLTLADEQVIFGANYFASKLPDGKAWLVWDKDASGMFSPVELAWTSREGRLRLYRHMWSGLRREGPRVEELGARVHPTQKPVGLFAQILGDYSQKGDRVLDPYLGSGTTLIACERTDRMCLGCEIDPEYCQVIIDRWEAFTGQQAKKVGEAVHA